MSGGNTDIARLYMYMTLSSLEDAYRIDAEVDGEVVGLDILDTAGQVRMYV